MASIIVHGGAYAIPDHLVAAKKSGVQLAATDAHKALMEGENGTRCRGDSNQAFGR